MGLGHGHAVTLMSTTGSCKLIRERWVAAVSSGRPLAEGACAHASEASAMRERTESAAVKKERKEVRNITRFASL